MQLQKYGHACFTLEKDHKILVVDPGSFSSDFIAPEQVVGVVITHQHADHFDEELLNQIMDKNPEAMIIGPSDVIDKIETYPTQVAQIGASMECGPFSLKIYGGVHAEVHSSMPRVENIGIMINDLVYYPGDSFDLPDAPVDVLALPVSGPWLKSGEILDFLTAVHPRLAFPVHDAINSDGGNGMIDMMASGIAKQIGSQYRRLDSPLDI